MSKMTLEDKLDQDFLFYLGFTNTFFDYVESARDKHMCFAWLKKLCGEPCRGTDRKRDRNIYLSNLLLQMQEGRLSEPFTNAPHTVDIANAFNVFGEPAPETAEPEWLKEVAGAGPREEIERPAERGARTYLATRTLPDGAGAFAYLAITLAEEEPRWLGGGEGKFDEQMEKKFKEMVPAPMEMERILMRRKDPAERQKVLVFYDSLLQNIEDELDGKVEPQQNDVINGLLEQLVEDLKSKEKYEEYEEMDERARRSQLLLLLHDKVKARRNKTAKYEEVLDRIEDEIKSKSFFDSSVEPQDKYLLPAAMWEQVINRPPAKKNMTLLQENYPLSLIEKFLELLSNYKEEIAIKMQKRHENMIGQMKKELRKEGEADKKKLEDAESACQQAQLVLADVKAARGKQLEIENRMAEKRRIPVSEHSQMYDQMRAALFDTQKDVEEEAEIGRKLAADINAVNEQMEVYMQVNEESVRKTEDVNMGIMKNIKRLRGAVKQYEGRLQQLQAMAKAAAKSGAKAGGQEFFFF